jgi:hypothetical protein
LENFIGNAGLVSLPVATRSRRDESCRSTNVRRQKSPDLSGDLIKGQIA